MSTVYVVQELTKYHCPKCDGTYSKRVNRPGEPNEYQCQNNSCGQRFYRGVLKPAHNLTPAAAFGKLQVLLTQHILPINLTPILEDMREKMADFGPDDYILPLGDPTATGLAAMIAAEKTDTVKFLRWDRQTRQYIEVKVTK